MKKLNYDGPVVLVVNGFELDSFSSAAAATLCVKLIHRVPPRYVAGCLCHLNNIPQASLW